MAEIALKRDPAELRSIAGNVLEQLKKAHEELKGVKNIVSAIAAAPLIVGHVQIVGQQLGLVGEDKKTLAVRVILDLVPDRWLPDEVLEPFVGWAVERAYAAAKKAGWALLEAIKKRLGIA